MLQAKLQSGQMIIPASMSKVKRRALKAAKPAFYCPSCGEEVILRAGEKVIAHFAHRASSVCSSSTGGEGAYHHHGKLLLYEWLSRQNLQVELEAYLPELKQRPDFLLHLNGRRIAVEYQCSKIADSEIIKRTKGYREHDIHVVWILGEKLLNRVGQQMIKLDSFTKTCIHQFSPKYPSSLFYFCPFTSNLVKFQDLSFLRQNMAIGKFTVKPMTKMNFSELLSAAYQYPHILLTAWKGEKKRFRTRRRGRKYGQERAWHQWLYLKKLHIESLPSIIHIPVNGAHLMKVPGWIWQSKIVFEIIAPLKLEQRFTLHQCESLLVKYKLNKNNFPLIKSDINPIEVYLEVLVQFDFIERKSPLVFQKKKHIPIHQELQIAIEEDNIIMERYFTKKQTKYEHVQQVVRYTK